MAIDPATAAMIAGTVSSLFSKKPSYTPGQRMQMDIARQLQAYAGGVPGSDPQEAALLASLNAQLGAGQAQSRDLLFAGMPPTARTDTGDMLRNVGARESLQRGNLNLQAALEFLARRKQAMLQAAQVAGSVGPKGEPGHQSGLPQMFGNLAQVYFQREAMKAAQPDGGGGVGSGGGGGGIVSGQTLGGVTMGPGMTGPWGWRAQTAAPAIPGAPAAPAGGGFLNAWSNLIGAMPQTAPAPAPAMEGPKLTFGGMLSPRKPVYTGVGEVMQRQEGWPRPRRR